MQVDLVQVQAVQANCLTVTACPPVVLTHVLMLSLLSSARVFTVTSQSWGNWFDALPVPLTLERAKITNPSSLIMASMSDTTD